ncbi:phosphatases II [Periconia macrospinosa]|uniref:Phosphatases II n=1 Tax=Periconia macrospinosa TaxID=97972 RepID=A0A2V1D6Z9_9PLEO|nr:phosphatases II [Periconia macrospinosa]
MSLPDASSAETSLSHGSHLEYSYRLPNAPRITVPPPSVASPPLELSLDHQHSPGQPGDDECICFLQNINLTQDIERDTILDWSYERRRQAQLVLPWLYLGPLTAAKDRDFLVREGITMAIAVRASPKSMNQILRGTEGICLDIATIEASNYFELTGKFLDAARMINSHMAKCWKLSSASDSRTPQMGKVLVFCESGNEKSAVVAAAYLMTVLKDLDHLKAMQVCQTQRFCVNFDDGAKTCLRSYWDILTARRFVSYQPNGSTELGQPPMRAKRTFEQTADDEDTVMDGGMDASDQLRFAGRDITPFRDD